MAYDENFYVRYAEYLQEPVVRKNHNHAFAIFSSLVKPGIPRVIDCGCGIGEYATYNPDHAIYIGIDVQSVGALKNLIVADYRELAFGSHIPFIPNAFISLFSIECCNPAKIRYELYHRIFQKFDTIRFGMTSGFFYASRRNKEMVAETGEIISYQTIEDPASVISPFFTELRVHMQTPSKMFGDDVIEVWKFFIRK